MRLRLYSLYLRRRTKTLTRQQRMESRRRGKRKSPSQAIIFEVSDGDISPEPSPEDCSEPDAKILKTDDSDFQLTSNEDSNLESNKPNLHSRITPNQESQDDSIVIIDCNSPSNNNIIEIPSSSEDIIDITLDDTNTPSVRQQTCSQPNNDSVEVDIVVDISEENKSPLKEDDFNLEEGELEDIPIGTDQVDSSKSSKSKSCICITFSDEHIAELYKSKFIKFVQSFVELEVENLEGLTLRVQRDSTLNPTEWVILDETLSSSEVKESVKEENVISPLLPTVPKSPCKKKKKKKYKKEKELFILDTNPSENANNGLCTKYSTKFQIDIAEKTMSKEEDTEVKLSAQICFNCDKNHAMKDCPKPKDFAKINAARQKFKAQKQTARYHLEEDQKYGHLLPGRISDRLRHALGLRHNQLPPFVYHMRILGYPPGWLEEAKFVHSNLEMFDSEGKNVREGATKKRQGLDPEKIINYPGFNVPVPQSVKDEYRHYNVPPFSNNFSKQAMINFFEKQYAKDQDDFESCDMDLDTTFEEVKEKNAEMLIEDMVIVNPLINELKEIDSNMPSPSLIDLEKQKETLLAALEDNSSSNPKSVETCGELDKSDVDFSSVLEKPKTSENTTGKVPVNKTLTIDIEKAQDSSTSFPSPPINSGINNVKNSTFGTPILKSSSPYSRLPNPDNFMKDVSPVINFENLPNSTGKYEQMTEVLQKVRSTLRKKTQNCKS